MKKKTALEMFKDLIKGMPLTKTEDKNVKVIEVALEKQIPKKPNVHGYREGREINTISYTCPACNKHISREDYCKHCGQALDWGDSE